jgi:hypothetical protein
MRFTSGLYYDLVPGGAGLLNDANDRFEQYCVDFIKALMPRFETSRSYHYGPKGAGFDSPDVLIKDGEKLVVVGDCKATKLSYLAQFAENPFDDGNAVHALKILAAFALSSGIAGAYCSSRAANGIGAARCDAFP